MPIGDGTRTIPLDKGFTAIVDEADYELVSKYRWRVEVARRRRRFYAATFVRDGGTRQTRILMHRLIIGAEPGQQVDHIDCDCLNNTRANLRLCTPSQNNQNARARTIPMSSQYKGVHRRKNRPNGTKCWVARITVDRKRVGLGFFDTEEEAALAYDAAALRYFGEFARPNLLPQQAYQRLAEEFDERDAADEVRVR